MSRLAKVKHGIWKWRQKLHLSKRKSAPAGLYFDLFRGMYRADGLTFEVPKDLTSRSFRSRFLFDIYEQEERALIRAHMPADVTVLELGACLGVVSCITNRLLRQPERHVVVDANPRVGEWIERNRRRNGADFAIEEGLVSRSSDGTFFLHDLVVGGSADRVTSVRVTAPVLTIEELEERHALTFDALVMDIEGGELVFVRENPDLFRRLRFACIEMHEFVLGDDGVAECESLLRAAGLERVGGDAFNGAWLRT